MTILMGHLVDPSVPRYSDILGKARQGDRSTGRSQQSSQAHTAALISRMVETEVLPRVARAQLTRETSNAPTAAVEDVNELVALLLSEPAADVMGFLERLRSRGISLADLYLGVMTDAALRLGDLWRDDRCNFVQVTIGMERLQMAIRSLSPDFQRAAVLRPEAETIMLLPAPGDQHIFGLMVLAEFFLRDGWHVVGGPGCSAEAAVTMVRENWIDVIGFSVSSTSQVAALAQCVRAVRRESRNRKVRVMVGGSLMLAQPGLALQVGADVAAADAQAALRQARELLQVAIGASNGKLMERSAVSN